MAAVETVFADRLSNEVVEVGIAFILKVMVECEVTDPVWERSFHVAQQFALQRPSNSLTHEEMVRVRDSALFRRPHLAVHVQRAISALG